MRQINAPDQTIKGTTSIGSCDDKTQYARYRLGRETFRLLVFSLNHGFSLIVPPPPGGVAHRHVHLGGEGPKGARRPRRCGLPKIP